VESLEGSYSGWPFRFSPLEKGPNPVLTGSATKGPGTELGAELSPAGARSFSRLHPRCGTAFLLFVLAISIVLYAFLVPWLLTFYVPQTAWIKQTYIVGLKLGLMVPVSCLAYEVIKLAGRFHTNIACRMLSAPGLFMQMLTTKEPDDRQLEVALAALRGAVERQPAV